MLLLAFAIGFALAAGAARAGALRFCDRAGEPSAEQKDVLLRFGAIVKSELEGSGEGVAIIARSGLDLRRFGHRYSHAGFALEGSPDTPWAVRQLYFACDEGRPRIFDQGLSGFVMGVDDPNQGYVSILLLPGAAARPLEVSALDKREALALLAADYSANAYPFSLRYQNCNQWVAEMLAAAWGGAGASRAAAQRWLQSQDYRPSVFDPGAQHLMALGLFIPWIHDRDHPSAEIDRRLYSVSMPASIEDFVRARWPATERIEICHAGRRVVIHHGWDALPEGCEPLARDRVLRLD